MNKFNGSNTHFFLVRHGLTDWSKEHRFQGSKNVKLNSSGQQEVKCLARFITNQTVGQPIIFSSDLDRAFETATIIGNRLGIEAIKTKRTQRS